MANEVQPARDAVPRRSFIGALLTAGSAWVGALLAIPVVRVVLFPLRNASEEAGWSDLGPLESFKQAKAPLAQQVNISRRDGWQIVSMEQTVYVVPGSGDQPRVLSSTCTHLGCTVQWQAEKDTFNCPCHGGVYAPDGARVSGPPPRGMDELPTRVQDGRLYVQFQNYRQLATTKEVAD